MVAEMNKFYDEYALFSENELVKLLKSGNKKAFEQLYHNYKVRIYQNLFKMVKSEGISERITAGFVCENMDRQRKYRS